MLLFDSGSGGYHTYRIPSLLSTSSGVLLAFAEGRRNSLSDTGDIDIVLRRSTDGGTTWGSMSVVLGHGTDTAGNPCVVQDPVSGDIVLLSSRNGGSDTIGGITDGTNPPRRVYVQRSSDDGQTWSSATEISSSVRPSWMRWYATGPGHGVALSSGRLVIPCCHTRAPSGSDTGSEAKYAGGHAIVSDDGGTTWTLGFTSSNPNGTVNENEAAVALLPDGSLYFNCRCGSDTSPGTRADAYSTDGGSSVVKSYRPQASIETAVVEGALTTLPDGRLVFSGPAAGSDRAAMALRTSADNGVSWRAPRMVSGLPAAYSDMAVVGTSVGLLYETGDWSPYDRIEFTTIPFDQLI